MKAITVQQPWAWAIVHGGKDVENRTRIGTWRSAVGQRIAIHAGQRISERGIRDLRVGRALLDRGRVYVEQLPYSGTIGQPLSTPLHLGVVIGLVDVEDVHLEEGGCCAPWGEQSYTEHGGTKRVDLVHLVLANPRPVQPVECRGALGLWTLPEHVAEALR